MHKKATVFHSIVITVSLISISGNPSNAKSTHIENIDSRRGCGEGFFRYENVCVNTESYDKYGPEFILGQIMNMKRGIDDNIYTNIDEAEEDIDASKGMQSNRVVALPKSGYIISRDGKSVACTPYYSSTGSSKDGSSVCAGGKYISYAISRDGSDVACGGEYISYANSRDGSSVCAGGEYISYAISRDGSDVACGGEYISYANSRDGSSVCAGGEYISYAVSRDGSDVACGGKFSGWAESQDGSKVCAGGEFNGCVHSKDGTHVSCGGWSILLNRE